MNSVIVLNNVILPGSLYSGAAGAYPGAGAGIYPGVGAGASRRGAGEGLS